MNRREWLNRLGNTEVCPQHSTAGDIADDFLSLSTWKLARPSATVCHNYGLSVCGTFFLQPPIL
jgi:hypothetical protein